RSTPLVALNELLALAPIWTDQSEAQIDPLEDRGVAPIANAIDRHLGPAQRHAGVARQHLDEVHSARGDAGKKGIARGDLLVNRRAIDDEVVILHRVQTATNCPTAVRADGIDDVFITHGSPASSEEYRIESQARGWFETRCPS